MPLVCNNAVWSVGELSMKTGTGFMERYVDVMLLSLIDLIQTQGIPDSLQVFLHTERGDSSKASIILFVFQWFYILFVKVNLAVVVGRLALSCPLKVSQYADEFFADWCRSVSMF
jgi:hypothetical protein